MSKSEFEQRFEEYVEFEWVVVKSLDLSLGFDELRLKKQFYVDFELLLNYNRYRKLVDTVELDWEDDEQEKWYNYYKHHTKKWKQDYYCSYQSEGARYFSTEAHAQAFLKLAQENDCL
jgi:hypothetical protein